MRNAKHECGWCACWRELSEAYEEGRQLEAVLEARRLIHPVADAAKCVTGVFIRGRWEQYGERV